jgi:hypothetical protein
MGRFLAVVLGLALALLGGTLAEATENSTGPVRVDAFDDVVCIAGNASTGNVNNVSVRIHFLASNGSSHGDAVANCPAVAPSTGCVIDTGGIAGDHSAFCEITFPSGKFRGTLCNVTKHLCSDTR